MQQPPAAASLERIPLASGATMIVARGTKSGPTLALLGGVHGDEDEGVLAVHRVLQEVAAAPLAGTLKAVAPANPLAWAAYSRTTPLDGDNLARCFPGDPAGPPTAALAASITAEVISGADLLIDLHSAGVRYSMPLLCGFVGDTPAAEASRRAAVAFGAPIIWSHAQSVPGRSLSAAGERGIPALYAECSGGGGIRGADLDTYVSGVLSVMADLGMLPPTYRRSRDTESRWVYGAGDLDDGAQSRHHGLFVISQEAGAIVPEGAEIGRLYDYAGRLLEVIRSPRQGVVMFLRRQARTQIGDVLFVLARLEDQQK